MLILIKSDYNYDNRIRAKYTAKWDIQIVEMIFQTRSKAVCEYSFLYILVISRRDNIRLLTGASVLVTIAAVTI